MIDIGIDMLQSVVIPRDIVLSFKTLDKYTCWADGLTT